MLTTSDVFKAYTREGSAHLLGWKWMHGDDLLCAPRNSLSAYLSHLCTLHNYPGEGTVSTFNILVLVTPSARVGVSNSLRAT